MGLEISIARAIPSFPVTSLCVVLADQRSALGYYPSALSVWLLPFPVHSCKQEGMRCRKNQNKIWESESQRDNTHTKACWSKEREGAWSGEEEGLGEIKYTWHIHHNTSMMLSLSSPNRCVRTHIYSLPHMEMKQVSVRLIRNPDRSWQKICAIPEMRFFNNARFMYAGFGKRRGAGVLSSWYTWSLTLFLPVLL